MKRKSQTITKDMIMAAIMELVRVILDQAERRSRGIAGHGRTGKRRPYRNVERSGKSID